MTQPERIYADELKQTYGVYGDYYTLAVDGEAPISCRSVLEIVAHDAAPLDLNSLCTRSVPTVCMMNPGSSRPRDGAYQPRTVARPEDIGPTRELVPAVPDNAQYQIMRVALKKGWPHVRILNLSDLREPSSGDFETQMAALPQGHSIFDPLRAEELAGLLDVAQPIITGWGLGAHLQALADMALRAISEAPHHYGIVDPENEALFAYPSPPLQKHKDRWLSEILDLLKDVA